MTQSPRLSWRPLLGAVAAGMALTLIAGWRIGLQNLDGQIAAKRAAVKKLVLGGGIPPNQEVMEYLTSRGLALEQREREWLGAVTWLPLAEATSADPQLYFQQQLHEIQRTIERLATARGMTVPQQLGFPKELPPADTVPRLLAQAMLMQEMTALIFDQKVAEFASVKLEDPDTSPETEDGLALTRLPIRVRVTCTLPQLMQGLKAVRAATPLIDVRELRIETGTAPESLDVELLACRYLATRTQQEDTTASDAVRPTAKPSEAQVSPRPHSATTSKRKP